MEPVKGFNLILLFFSVVFAESSTTSGFKSPRAADVTLCVSATEAASEMLNLDPVKGHGD